MVRAFVFLFKNGIIKDMYNWSVDEKKFKKEEEVIEFLRNQPEIEKVERSGKKDEYNNCVIETELSPNIHSVRRFCIAKYIQERIDNLSISVIEKRKNRS